MLAGKESGAAGSHSRHLWCIWESGCHRPGLYTQRITPAFTLSTALKQSNLSRSLRERLSAFHFWMKLSSLPCPSGWQCMSVCVCVQTMIFLSLVLFKSTRISLAHSAIPGLSTLPTCVWRSALHSVRTENWYPGSAFTRPWPNSVELTIAQVAYFTSPPESVLWVQV